EVFISDFGQGANGTVTEDGEGGLVYTPNADFNGFDSFTYTVSDGNGGTDTETVTVTVTPVNDDPVATPETLTVAEDGSAVVYPSFDTTDVDGDEVFISDFGQGANGTVTEDGEGGLVYTPNADFNGTDSFTYTVSDGNGGTDTETVSVTVTPVNDDPVANDDVVSTTTGILLFDNESVIDSNNDVPAYDEAQTLVASLESFGHEVEITEALDAAGLSAALEGKSIFVLPEQEQAALGTFMSEAGQDVIRDFVGNGGTMFMGMDYRGTLNDLFGFSTSYSTAGSFEITDAAIGTPFEGGPASLQPHSATHGLLASSLPPGAVSLYESSTGYVAVALLPYGEGQILYLGWDWFSAMPLGEMDGGWLEVLDRATALGDTAPISEGSVTVIAEADLLANDTDIDGDTLFILSVSATSAAGATVSFADGEVRYDPTDVAAFDALGEGESLSDTFTYTVSDGNGGTDTATVTVVVAGVNDDPVAQNSVLEVEADGSATGQVVATDVDGDTLTYTLATAPEHGIVVLGADGAYTYTPDEGYVGFDSFVMLVSDGNGGSDTATVTLEVAQEAYPVSEDQSISMALSEEPVGDAPAGNLRIGVGEVQSNTINLSFALDASGSVGSAGWANIENAIYDAVEQLSGQFDGSATIVNVQIIQYGLGVYADLRYDLNDPALLTAIQSLEFANGSQTDWHLAMDASHAFFSSQDPSDTNILYFVTDGVPSGSTWEASLATLNGAAYDVDIQAFGIGTGFNTSQLQQVDSDGSPTAVSDSAALLEAIQQSPLFAAQLVELSLSLVADGVDHGVIADETSPALTSDGLNFNLPLADIAGIGELLGEENFFSASAVFDLDGDLNTTDDRVTINSFERIAKHDTAQTLTGTDGPDLILGSDEDDVLSGGEGDDILIGFSGTDIFDGGPGRDLLELATGAAPNLIETLAGSDIEAIGLHNGVADTLFIDATDVINLSSTADTDLELLLNEALGDSATILGEVGDSITLMPEGSGSWETAATGVDDGKGNTLDIYQFVEGGVVMATLGIDDDVTVNIPVLT
ncbi:MAG: Ig-like domain-containing protein, partial [Pseudomonadota bacterium]|nr:Ig-like domain-containing protein [Pseudomonadota bacterium]